MQVLITIDGKRKEMSLVGAAQKASEGKDISISDMTKEQYIQQVKDNGGDTYQVCIYNKLIDTYGVKETLKLDMRSAADENDVDPRVYSIMQECL